MAKRSRNVGVRKDRSGSTRDWLVDGTVWEIETTLAAVPLVIVAGVLTFVFDVPFTVVIVIAVVALLAVRLVVGGLRNRRSSGSSTWRSHEDL